MMTFKSKSHKINLPIIMERDEEGIYVVECPLLKGCYTQGESMEKALESIREVIEMWSVLFLVDIATNIVIEHLQLAFLLFQTIL
jgi:predicted RNase H-like HicB family nuclease